MRAAVVRASLSVACVVAFNLTLHAEGVGESPTLRERDVRRAEKVIAKLRLLDGAAAASDGASEFHKLAAKFYPDLFVTVADMRRSDLKTDLDTAVFLYAEVNRTWLTAGNSSADCGRQRRDIYLPLCLDLRGGTTRQLLVSKARLHTRWAEAIVKNYRGEPDAETSRSLAAMKAARENDLVIAARVIDTLKTLERLVNAVPAYADRDGQRVSSGIGFDRLDREFGDALQYAGALIYSLPRGPAYYSLSNAWRSFKDGQFWYHKVHQSKKLVVSANGFERDSLADLRLDAAQVSHTVVANWEAAIRYTRLVEQTLSAPIR